MRIQNASCTVSHPAQCTVHTVKFKYPILYTQPIMCNTQPIMCNTQPIMSNTQPIMCDTQPRWRGLVRNVKLIMGIIDPIRLQCP